VTDVGSVKASVVAELGVIFQGRARFIGSHPMAGSEQTGLAAARADLFAGRVCIVTPTVDTDAGTVRDASAFWQSLGGLVHVLTPEAHDEAVAWISHLPHLLAPALVNLVAAQAPGALAICGPGFASSTRLASSLPSMWTEIFAQNHPAVRKSLDALIEKLRELSTILARADLERDSLMTEFLNQAKAQRDRLRLPN
jgi:prephenate dehydrogenase